MNNLQFALKAVQTFETTSSGFTSDHKIYEPETSDIPEVAALKRYFIELAKTAQLRAMEVLAGGSVGGSLKFDSTFSDRISNINEPAWSAYASAVALLIAEINKNQI